MPWFVLKIGFWLSKNQSCPSISDCNCNPGGSITLECNDNGDCACKNGYAGQKCDKCKPNMTGETCEKCDETFFNYPSWFTSKILLFQTAIVTLMVRQLWNVEKSMVIALAKRDLQD